jgi:hypothetical protein
MLLVMLLLVTGVLPVPAVCMQQQSMGMQRVTATWMQGLKKKLMMLMTQLQRRIPFSALV